MTTIRSTRRLGALLAVPFLAVALVAPSVAAASPVDGAAASFDGRGSARDGAAARTADVTTSAIDIRDLRFACPPGRVPAAGFRDIAGSDFVPAIDCLVWYGVTEGRTPTSFEPNGQVTRRQMALFLYRLLEDTLPARTLPAYDGSSTFRDVPDTGIGSLEINVLASPELAELLGTPIITGRDARTYDPSGTVSRAQMGSFIARTVEGIAEFYEGSIRRGSCTFPDQDRIPPVHADNVSLLCELGIVGGRNDGTYGPAADVTRGQMAAFLTRTLDVFAEPTGDGAAVVVPPDERSEVSVDASATCAGGDGTPARPFCTIQEGVAAAGTRAGDLVDVLVAPGTYTGDVTLTNGQAAGIGLVAEGSGRTPLQGRVTVTGEDADGLHLILGFDVIGGAVSRAAGSLIVLDSRLAGATALLIEQVGAEADTWVLDSVVVGTSRGLDIVASPQVPLVEGVAFSGGVVAGGAYVVIPAGAGEGALDFFTEADAGNTFPAPPARTQLGGRWALVPS